MLPVECHWYRPQTQQPPSMSAAGRKRSASAVPQLCGAAGAAPPLGKQLTDPLRITDSIHPQQTCMSARKHSGSRSFPRCSTPVSSTDCPLYFLRDSSSTSARVDYCTPWSRLRLVITGCSKSAICSPSCSPVTISRFENELLTCGSLQ